MKTYIFSFEYNRAKSGETLNDIHTQVVVVVAKSLERAIHVANEKGMKINKSNFEEVLTNEEMWQKDSK